MMKKLIKHPFIVIFSFFVFGFMFLGIIKKDTEFSVLENRYLTVKPQLSLKKILDTSFEKEYETYLNEQFPFRNEWVSLKAASEAAIGKLENNGIIKGNNGYLFDKQITINKQFEKNKQELIKFTEQINIPTQIAIAPNSYAVMSQNFADFMPNFNQEEAIKAFYAELKDKDSVSIDMFKVLKEHSNEYIYYRTDHHWTTLGAYYGYEAYCRATGLNPVTKSELKSIEIPGFYGTYYSKYKGKGIASDTITYYDISIENMMIDKEQKTSLYDLEKAGTHDKYSMFLYGNNALSIIKSKESKVTDKGKKKLLVIKDSYANSFIPYLTYHYGEIYVVDLRYYTGAIRTLVQENKIDQVLILYNFDTFMSDNNVYRINK
jgi:hypothetical protein